MHGMQGDTTSGGTKRAATDALEQHGAKRYRPDSATPPSTPLIHDTMLAKYMTTSTFYVGPDALPFALHTNLLRSRCRRYYKTLNRAVSDSIDEDARTFEMFAACLHSDEVPLSSKTIDEDPIQRLVTGPSQEEAGWHDLDLVQLWTFAARHDIYDLMSAAISCLAMQNDQRGHIISRAAVKVAFEEYSGKRDYLKRFLVDEAIYRLGNTKTPSGTEHYPVAYISRIFEAVMAATAAGKSKKRSRSIAQWSDATECKRVWVDSPPRKNRIEFPGQIDDTTVSIFVGEEQIPFIVHKDLICYYSEYFRGAFDGKFSESGRGTLSLPDEDPIIFRIYVDWLYRQEVCCPDAATRKTTEDYLGTLDEDVEHDENGGVEFQDAISFAEDTYEVQTHSGQGLKETTEPGTSIMSALTTNVDEQTIKLETLGPVASPFNVHLTDGGRMYQRMEELLDLYILADRRDTRMLRNVVMTSIIDLRQKRWHYMSSCADLVTEAYEWLPPRCHFCEYLVEEASFCWSKKNQETQRLRKLTLLPNVFLGRVVRTLFECRVDEVGPSRLPRWCKNACKYYHEHKGDQVEKASCRNALASWQKSLAAHNFDSQMNAVLDWTPTEFLP